MSTVPPAEWSLLKGLTPDQVNSTLAVARLRTYKRGTTVFHQGDAGDSVHVVTRGHFAFRVQTENGESSTLRVFGPGETFGRVTIPGRVTSRMGTIVALDAGETYELSRDQVRQLRASYPEVVNAIIEILSQELHWLSQRLLEVLYVDADRRVRRRLVELRRQYADGTNGAVICLTQEDLAGLAGTSRSTVNRVLRDEERQGTIAVRRGRIVLVDAAQLARRGE